MKNNYKQHLHAHSQETDVINKTSIDNQRGILLYVNMLFKRKYFDF